MAKIKIMKSVVAEVQTGGRLLMEDGNIVIANLNKNSQAGDTCQYVEMRSLVTVRYQAGSTQWKDSKPTGHKFFKEV